MNIKFVLVIGFAFFVLSFANGADQAMADQKLPQQPPEAIVGGQPADSTLNWTNLTVLTPCPPWGCFYYRQDRIDPRDAVTARRLETAKIWANRVRAQEQAQQDIMTSLLQAPSFVSQYQISSSNRTNR